MIGGLYLHVPFCGALCSYCHFARTDRHDETLRRRTVAAMVAEFELHRKRCAGPTGDRHQLATAYLGGGTPSLLEADLASELIAGTVDRLPTGDDFEFTAEANPESLTPAVMESWRAAGVNRVSLGVQSLSDQVLQRLGRRCDPATARRALASACEVFPRVSADWILAPGVTSRRLAAELDEAVDLGVQHVSFYILEVHEGTPLARAVAAGQLTLPPDADIERRYLAAVEHLARRGLVQYEVSNFALPGAESRHNRAYWTGRPYLGVGPSASGFWGRRRYTNERSLGRYLERVEAGELPEAEVDRLTPSARRLEALVLPLRTVGGVQVAALPEGALDLERGQKEELWTVDEGRVRLTTRGFLRLDTIEACLARAVG